MTFPGATDIVAHIIGQWLADHLGEQFIIEHRPGAGTNLGTEAVVRAAADGYTLLVAPSAVASNATFYEKLNFNFIRDMAPVAGIVALTPSVTGRFLDAMANCSSKADLVAIHSGGDGYSGYMTSAGVTVIADGTTEAAGRLKLALDNDTSLGVMRYADAGYNDALDEAAKKNIRYFRLGQG